MISSFSSVACIKKPMVPFVYYNYGSVVIIGPGGGNSNSLGRTSDSGNTWTYGSAPFPVNVNTKICCGNVNAAPLWVIVGNDAGTMKSATSTNGTTWTTSISLNSTIPGTNNAYISCLTFGNGIFMVSGHNMGLSATGTPIAISSDGLTWVKGGIIFGPGKITNAVGYGNGYWLAVPNLGSTTNNVRYSTNVSIADSSNISWSILASIPEDPLYSVIYTDNRWYIGARQSKVYYSVLNPQIPPGNTPTFAVKNVIIPYFQNNIPYALSSVPGILAIGMWFPGSVKVFQTDSIGTTTFIAVGSGDFVSVLNTSDPVNSSIDKTSEYFGGNLLAIISTDRGNTWANLTSVNTNMAAGCYGVAFAK